MIDIKQKSLYIYMSKLYYTVGHTEIYARGDMTSTIQQELQVASLNQEPTLPIAEEAPKL